MRFRRPLPSTADKNMNGRALPALLILVAALLCGLWGYSWSPSRTVVGVRKSPPGYGRVDAVAETLEGDDAHADARESAARPPVDAELARAFWVEGRVVFPAGTPDDEVVWVIARGSRFQERALYKQRVDRDGRFRIAFCEWTRTARFLVESRYLYLDEEVSFERAQLPSQVVLEPSIGGRLEGRIIVEARCKPGLVDAKMNLVCRGRGDEPHVRRECALDGSSAYAFAAMPAGSSYVLRFEGPAFVDKLLPDVQIRAGVTTTLDLAPASGATIEGVVLSDRGIEVSGAYVGVSVDGSLSRVVGELQRSPSAVTTGVDGSFRIAGVPAGRVTLSVEHDDHLVTHQELGDVANGDMKRGVVVTLFEGNVITGRVLWPDNVPAAGARVGFRTLEQDEREEDASPILTDEKGRFRIAGLRQGPFVVHASIRTRGGQREEASWLWRARASDVKPGTQGLVLNLDSGLELRGQVVDLLGAPVTRFLLSAEPDIEGTSERILAVDRRVAQVFRSADGRFVLRGLDRGDWRVVASARGFEVQEAEVVSIPQVGDLTIILESQEQAD